MQRPALRDDATRMVRDPAVIPDGTPAAASCVGLVPLPADVCQPRVRKRLLVVGRERPVDPGADLMTLAAGRLATRVACVADEPEASAYLDENAVSCVVLDASGAGGETLATVTRLSDAHPAVPIVVLGREADPEVAVAIVQGGAQDYVYEPDLDPVALERAIRHAIDRHRARVELRQLALHDHLTGAGNRVLFGARLAEALSPSGGDDGLVAVMFVDIDGFKRINDNLGHAAGDDALRAAAERMRASIRPADTLARFGGDEFTVLCGQLPDAEAALALARRIAHDLSQPLELDGAEVVLRASVGVTTGVRGASTPDGLLREADEAMYEAKHRGGSRAESYVPSRRESGNALALEAELRHAIPSGLRLLYQPQVRLVDGAMVGAEALLRWHHPERGVVNPCDFIPLAEQSGLIVPIGRWVLGEACAEAVRLGAVGGGPGRVSVNVSGRQVADPRLVSDVESALESSGLAPELLELELTESVLIEHLDEGVALVRRLKELGVSVALDDFGTGYSSLSYLKQLPVDTIKIDRSFVSGLPDCREDLAIVSAVISFARALGMGVIAEGVETQAHVEALLELGCEHVQGFHFHRPLEPERLHALWAS
jgi:diguanylate cyclase (GGDEF)-like protein